jgi:hypothetical protein
MNTDTLNRFNKKINKDHFELIKDNQEIHGHDSYKKTIKENNQELNDCQKLS